MVCVWIESENSIDKDTILKLHKIDSSRFYFIAQDKKYSAEGIGDLLTNLLSSDLKPDMVVILGDRYEMLMVAAAAMIAKIPISHIHGGEITEGAYDDGTRHSEETDEEVIERLEKEPKIKV